MPSGTSARAHTATGVAVLAVTATSMITLGAAAPALADDGSGRVLSSPTTHPSGRDVTTTFLAARVEAARNGWQGTSEGLPNSLAAAGDTVAVPGPMRLDGDLVSSPSSDATPYQRFDLPWRGAGQSILWSGQVDSARAVVVSAWDGTAWEELTRARGLGADPLTLQADVAARHVHGGLVPVLVHAEDPFADDIDHEVKLGLEDPWDYDFAIAHHSDTQHMTRGSITKKSAAERLLWQRGFSDATRWIADNAKVRKIAFAAHTGDLVEDWVNVADQADPAMARRQFASASDSQRILDKAGVITATLPGNHDNLHGRDTGTQAMFNEEFGPDRYEALARTDAWVAAGATYAPWKEGDAANSVTTFTAGGLDFVAVSLGFGVTAEEAAWADRTLKAYPDRNAIVLTHAYATASPSPDGRGAGFAEDGARVLRNVVEPNPNVALVLAGHKEGVSIGVRKDVGARGNHVLELMANYQYYTFKAGELGIDVLGGYSPTSTHRLGASFLRLLQFDVDRSEVSIDTYSPYRNMFGATSQDPKNRYDGREDDFRMPVQLTSRRTSFSTDALLSVAPGDEEIGTATGPSGSRAEVTWDDLAAGSTYGWRSVATDAETGVELADASPLAWFVARSGADSTAPRLSVPGATTLAHGATFDPMKGVSARDDDGTSLTSQVVVTGRIDTSRPGTQSLSYLVSDAVGNTAVATRLIVVANAPAPVNTGVPKITGKATVGEVLTATRGTWTNLRESEVRIQWLRNGSAISGATGTEYLVTTKDIGKLVRAKVEVRAAGRQPVQVTSAARTPGKMKPTLTMSVKSKFSKKKKALVKVRVANDWVVVTGTVTVKVGTKKVATLKLNSTGRAQVRLPQQKVGKRKITVVYSATTRFTRVAKATTVTVTKK